MSVHAGTPFNEATAMMPAKIGPYEIRGVLGRGESATIYLGRELFPARDVAIKVYDPRLLASEDRALFRSLFLKEALLAKKLTHPNITQVHDAAADDERVGCCSHSRDLEGRAGVGSPTAMVPASGPIV